MENQEANSPVEDKDDNDNVIFTPGENEIVSCYPNLKIIYCLANN